MFCVWHKISVSGLNAGILKCRLGTRLKLLLELELDASEWHLFWEEL